MAATEAMANRHIVATVLHELSNMKYKDRRQYGPDQPVEFLEFRPTLVPSILVNRLWADEGTSILWRRYPHLPALQHMDPVRRQYYANKVHHVFSLSPAPGSPETFDYLDRLQWPNLKTAELEIDWQRHGDMFSPMLHPDLERLELGSPQSAGSAHFADTVLPSLFSSCTALDSLRISPDTISNQDPLPASTIFEYLDSTPSIKAVQIKGTSFVDKDALFVWLSQRADLKELEIDLEPGLSVLLRLQGARMLPPPFASLKRLHIMCYPEIALALPRHLRIAEELQFEIARIPDEPAQDSDYTILEALLAQLSNCSRLRLLKVGLGLTAINFPSNFALPQLDGEALIRLAKHCRNLEDLNLFSIEPSAIDASGISSEQFDEFCRNLPGLRKLSLKLHPTTTSTLEMTALQSLGAHCQELEVLRLKIPFLLPSLLSDVPQILVSDESASWPHSDAGITHIDASINRPDSLSSECVPAPLFPNLTHLAISRPETILAMSSDYFTVSSMSSAASEIFDPTLEEELVRSWACPILAHFPSIEILEAWGDWSGQDNESLNYFLPTEEILASTWEFLSGIEQDLWDDDEFEEGDSWELADGCEDWKRASLMNEFIPEADLARLSMLDDESEDMITPRTLDDKTFFDDLEIEDSDEPSAVIISIEQKGISSVAIDELKNPDVS